MVEAQNLIALLDSLKMTRVQTWNELRFQAAGPRGQVVILTSMATAEGPLGTVRGSVEVLGYPGKTLPKGARGPRHTFRESVALGPDLADRVLAAVTEANRTQREPARVAA